MMMLRASTLLSAVPNLTDHAKETLQRLVTKGGDPEIHLPGLPGLPALPDIGPLAQGLEKVLEPLLTPYTFEFYQAFGVRLKLNEVQLGGLGFRLSESINIKNPAPVPTFTPILELGSKTS